MSQYSLPGKRSKQICNVTHMYNVTPPGFYFSLINVFFESLFGNVGKTISYQGYDIQLKYVRYMKKIFLLDFKVLDLFSYDE